MDFMLQYCSTNWYSSSLNCIITMSCVFSSSLRRCSNFPYPLATWLRSNSHDLNVLVIIILLIWNPLVVVVVDKFSDVTRNIPNDCLHVFITARCCVIATNSDHLTTTAHWLDCTVCNLDRLVGKDCLDAVCCDVAHLKPRCWLVILKYNVWCYIMQTNK